MALGKRLAESFGLGLHVGLGLLRELARNCVDLGLGVGVDVLRVVGLRRRLVGHDGNDDIGLERGQQLAVRDENSARLLKRPYPFNHGRGQEYALRGVENSRLAEAVAHDCLLVEDARVEARPLEECDGGRQPAPGCGPAKRGSREAFKNGHLRLVAPEPEQCRPQR